MPDGTHQQQPELFNVRGEKVHDIHTLPDDQIYVEHRSNQDTFTEDAFYNVEFSLSSIRSLASLAEQTSWFVRLAP